MITLTSSAQINSVDAPVGATTNVLNVDLRGTPGAGGFFEAEIPATAVAAGTVSIPVTVNVVDTEGATSTVNIDARQQPNEGGFASIKTLTAGITYAGAAAPVAPTLGTSAAGSLGARNETYQTTYVDANGNESLPSPTAAEALSANNVATLTSPAASTNAVKYNVYGVITGGTPTLQNATPIALATNWTEPTTGLLTTGRVAPTASTLVAGAATLTIANGGTLAQGPCTLTLTQ